ncbi:MAG: hypothetical protein ACFFAH_14220 [Promethearchaeota archaeon]
MGGTSAPLCVIRVGDSNRKPPTPGLLKTIAAISTIFSSKENIYVILAANAIFYGSSYEGGMIIDLNLGIITIIVYFIPCLIFSYLFFKKRDV